MKKERKEEAEKMRITTEINNVRCTHCERIILNGFAPLKSTSTRKFYAVFRKIRTKSIFQ